MTAPYRAETYRSMERAFVQPKGLRDLLAWFLHEWALEVPDTVHTPGVWRDYVRWDEDRKAVGGSLIGAPPLAEPFRRYIENSARELDDNGYYVRPMHRAIAELAGRREDTEGAFRAQVLLYLAWSHGAIDKVAAPLRIHPLTAHTVAEDALARLWRAWRSSN